MEKIKKESDKLKAQINEFREKNLEFEKEIKENTIELKNVYKDFIERLNKFIELQT